MVLFGCSFPQVLEVKVIKRKGPVNFMACLRNTLNKHYGTKPVGIGGTFLIESGKANFHVMVCSSLCLGTECVWFVACAACFSLSGHTDSALKNRQPKG